MSSFFGAGMSIYAKLFPGLIYICEIINLFKHLNR
jgi:hypothetical protein